ncbi:hypothetical protein EDC94DRAFT_655215 [Helicostylum pulchrum]|nr:hypothetical protein EDC94DRAFT_655215 [Helicostylum pulchrum]
MKKKEGGETQDNNNNEGGETQDSTKNKCVKEGDIHDSSVRLSNWYDIQRITIPILSEALGNIDCNPLELVVANILHRAALLLVSGSPTSDLEDSFIHNFIANLFENIFQSEFALESNWANGQLGGKRKPDDEEYTDFKPDYVVFVSQKAQRLDLTIAEAKSPNN